MILTIKPAFGTATTNHGQTNNHNQATDSTPYLACENNQICEQDVQILTRFWKIPTYQSFPGVPLIWTHLLQQVHWWSYLAQERENEPRNTEDKVRQTLLGEKGYLSGKQQNKLEEDAERHRKPEGKILLMPISFQFSLAS